MLILDECAVPDENGESIALLDPKIPEITLFSKLLNSLSILLKIELIVGF